MKIIRLFSLTVLIILAIKSHLLMAADFTNSIGMKFNNVPSGTFYMGSCDVVKNKKLESFLGSSLKKSTCPHGAIEDVYLAEDETPQRKVQITKSFQMGIYEVTVKEFKQFIADEERYDLITDKFIRFNQNDQTPVTMVSWVDVQDFIAWLNKVENTLAYRLPTEAEWEYVARAGTNTIFSWGNNEKLAHEFEQHGLEWGEEPHAFPVGGKQPNPWGFYDMHGNVSEWVQDWYKDDYYMNMPVIDPKGPSNGEKRVTRGGTVGVVSWGLRSATRSHAYPSLRYSNVGFRLVKEVKPTKQQ